MTTINNATANGTYAGIAKAEAKAATAMERLSSGVRVNSAKDDSAGLAASNHIDSLITSFKQAVTNVNDGISMGHVAEDGLEEIESNLIRVSELLVQAGDGIYTEDAQNILLYEIEQRFISIAEIISTSAFNEINLLSNKSGAVSGGVTTKKSTTVNQINLATINANFYSGMPTASMPSVPNGSTTKEVLLDGISVPLADSNNGNGYYLDESNKVQLKGAYSAKGTQLNPQNLSVSYYSNNPNPITLDFDLQSQIPDRIIELMPHLLIGDFKKEDIRIYVNDSDTPIGLNRFSYDGFNKIDIDFDNLEFTGNTIDIQIDYDFDKPASFEENNFNFHIGSTGNEKVSLNIGAFENLILDLYSGITSDVDRILTWKNEGRVDKALDQVLHARAKIGATQSRMANVSDDLLNANDEFASSRSRIMDADYAKEMAVLTKNQVLSKAGYSVANQLHDLKSSLVMEMLKN